MSIYGSTIRKYSGKTDKFQLYLNYLVKNFVTVQFQYLLINQFSGFFTNFSGFFGNHVVTDKLRRGTVQMVADKKLKAGETTEEVEAYCATMEKPSEFGTRVEAAAALQLMNLQGEVT